MHIMQNRFAFEAECIRSRSWRCRQLSRSLMVASPTNSVRQSPKLHPAGSRRHKRKIGGFAAFPRKKRLPLSCESARCTQSRGGKTLAFSAEQPCSCPAHSERAAKCLPRLLLMLRIFRVLHWTQPMIVLWTTSSPVTSRVECTSRASKVEELATACHHVRRCEPRPEELTSQKPGWQAGRSSRSERTSSSGECSCS
jgi:hypothetical protein